MNLVCFNFLCELLLKLSFFIEAQKTFSHFSNTKQEKLSMRAPSDLIRRLLWIRCSGASWRAMAPPASQPTRESSKSISAAAPRTCPGAFFLFQRRMPARWDTTPSFASFEVGEAPEGGEYGEAVDYGALVFSAHMLMLGGGGGSTWHFAGCEAPGGPRRSSVCQTHAVSHCAHQQQMWCRTPPPRWLRVYLDWFPVVSVGLSPKRLSGAPRLEHLDAGEAFVCFILRLEFDKPPTELRAEAPDSRGPSGSKGCALFQQHRERLCPKSWTEKLSSGVLWGVNKGRMFCGLLLLKRSVNGYIRREQISLACRLPALFAGAARRPVGPRPPSSSYKPCSFTTVSTGEEEEEDEGAGGCLSDRVSAHLCQADTKKATVNRLTLRFLGRPTRDNDRCICCSASAPWPQPTLDIFPHLPISVEVQTGRRVGWSEQPSPNPPEGTETHDGERNHGALKGVFKGGRDEDDEEEDGPFLI